jgi:membrane protein YdbS with pleckstrin-like domain
MTENNIVYQARLHWIIFVWPVVMLCVTGYLAFVFKPPQIPSYVFTALAMIALLWGASIGLTYLFSYLIIKNKQVILCTGIWVRQTIDIPMAKIESIDIRQSILGSVLRYGSLVITGTGGTRQVVAFLSKPLTCRRYIEQLMHA